MTIDNVTQEALKLYSDVQEKLTSINSSTENLRMMYGILAVSTFSMYLGSNEIRTAEYMTLSEFLFVGGITALNALIFLGDCWWMYREHKQIHSLEGELGKIKNHPLYELVEKLTSSAVQKNSQY